MKVLFLNANEFCYQIQELAAVYAHELTAFGYLNLKTFLANTLCTEGVVLAFEFEHSKSKQRIFSISS